VKSRQAAKSLEENVLQDILRLDRVPDQGIDENPDRLPVGSVKIPERVLVAAPGRQDETSFNFDRGNPERHGLAVGNERSHVVNLSAAAAGVKRAAKQNGTLRLPMEETAPAACLFI
jgi:hypothetical protein